MDKLVALCSTVDGRIARGQFWLGSLIVFVAFAIISALLMALGLGVSSTVTGTVQVNGGEASEFMQQNWSLAPWPSLILTVVAAAPLAAVGVKRRHDRNGSGVDVIAFWIVSLLLQFLAVLGVSGGFLQAVGLVMAVWGICLFILLGILKGTPGPNKYGPDPVGRAATA